MVFNTVIIELIPGPWHNIQLIILVRTFMCEFYNIHKIEHVSHILLDGNVALI